MQPLPAQPVLEVVITTLWLLTLTGEAKVLESHSNLPLKLIRVFLGCLPLS